MKSARFPLRILLIGSRERLPMVEQALAQAGHKVASAIAPEDDLPIAAQRLQPEALVIEVEAPTRDLLRGLRRVYERQPLPVVVFADRSSEEDIRTAIKAGVSS